MVFKPVELDVNIRKLIDDEIKSYDHSKGVQLHEKKELPRKRFRWIRVWALAIIPTLLFIPLMLIALIQRLMMTKKSVNSKVILITGAARGLGRQMSLQFGRLGAKIVCVDINGKGAEETAMMVNTEGGKAIAFTTNVAKTDEVEKLREDVEREFGPVDILINNAAIAWGFPIKQWKENEIRTFYEINVLSHIWMIKTFLPSMRERKSGQIVTISSAGAFFPIPYLSLYASSKAAVTSLADNLRVELEMMKEPIKFTTIHPTIVNTSLEYNEFLKFGFPPLREETAVRCMVDAILLERENVTVPESVWTMAAFDMLLPRIFRELSWKILDPKICFPEVKIFKALPHSRIMKQTERTNKMSFDSSQEPPSAKTPE